MKFEVLLIASDLFAHILVTEHIFKQMNKLKKKNNSKSKFISFWMDNVKT